MAIAVIGGLSFALVLALFFVPYVYLITKGMRNNTNAQRIFPIAEKLIPNQDENI
jgi:hypothetical protein